MMSVLVKGMKMPKNCEECDFCHWSNLHQTGRCDRCDDEPVCADFGTDYKRTRARFCPLVEVPTPHGRLVDVDAFKADYGMKDDCADCEKECQGKTRACEYDRIYSKMDFCSWLDIADVVIEAEVERE